MADPHNEVTIKWQGKEFSIALAQNDTVGELKRKIEEQTEVQPKRQKLLGLKAKAGGGLPADSVHVHELVLKPGMKVMMMGWAPFPCFHSAGTTIVLMSMTTRCGADARPIFGDQQKRQDMSSVNC